MNAALLAAARDRGRLPTVGLMVLYDFVQGANSQVLYDKSSNGRNGVLGGSNAAEATDPLWNAQGLYFDGIDDYVLLPNQPASTGADTFMFTVSAPSPATVAAFYSQGVQSGTQGFFWIFSVSGRIYTQYANGTAVVTTNTSETYAVGDFVCIVHDYSQNLIQFYRNGILRETRVITSPILPAAGDGFLGTYSAITSNNRSLGTQSHFSRHARALSGAEIKAAQLSIRKNLARRGVFLP